MTWECSICGHKNPDTLELCEECGSYREEPCYDTEDDLESEEDV
jgi:hypothetical protein